MPKRSSTASAASKRSAANRSSKRVKADEADDKSEANKPVENFVRDPTYYFEDGSVTFRVNEVLFKVHTSLLKAHSEDLFKHLDLPPEVGEITAESISHDAVIAVPGVQPSRFRNLMKIIYCLPTSNVVFTQPSPTDNQDVVGDFCRYLDIVILARKLTMVAIEQWAKAKLSHLVHDAGKILAAEFNSHLTNLVSGNDNPFHDDDSISVPTVHGVRQATMFYAFRFIEAIQYARAVSDSALLHDMLNIAAYHFARMESHAEFLLSYLRILDLRKTDPFLFGFLFLLILGRGNQVWLGDMFTQEDRMALFSAQSFLTPLPESLKESILTPLFTRPIHVNPFAAILSENTGCGAECHKVIFGHWERVFPATYYTSINENNFSVSIKALATLPSRRLDLVVWLRQTKCQQCCQKVLDQLDKDMQEVFARLAGYYKVYG